MQYYTNPWLPSNASRPEADPSILYPYKLGSKFYPWLVDLLLWLDILLWHSGVFLKIVIHADCKGVILIQPVIVCLRLSSLGFLQRRSVISDNEINYCLFLISL